MKTQIAVHDPFPPVVRGVVDGPHRNLQFGSAAADAAAWAIKRLALYEAPARL